MPAGSHVHRWTLPSFSLRTSPAASRTRTCLETCMRETSKGAARSVTDAAPRVARRVRMARRVGCARAEKARSRASSAGAGCLMIINRKV